MLVWRWKNSVEIIRVNTNENASGDTQSTYYAVMFDA